MHIQWSLCVPPASAWPQTFLYTENAASEKRFIAILGKVHLPCWRFIVVRHGGHVHRKVFLHSVPQINRRWHLPIPPRTSSSSSLFVSQLLQCPESHGDVITVICVVERKDLDSAGSLWEGVADAHPLFQICVFEGLFDWDLRYRHFDPLCGLSLLSCYQVLVWHHCHQVFTSRSAWQVDLCRFSLLDVPSRWRRRMHVVCAIKYVWPPH